MKYVFFFVLIICCTCCRSGPEAVGQTTAPRYIYQDTLPPHPADSIAISYGSFFGMCFGYCQADYYFHPWGIVKYNHADPSDSLKYPAQQLLLPIRKTQYDSLVLFADFAAFSKLPERIGCPDCADGGGEWITIECGLYNKTVVFPYGQNIPEIETFLKLIREVKR